MGEPWFYPDRVSAAPGETVRLSASGPQSPCRLDITRIGREFVAVAAFDGIAIGDHATPPDAASEGCGWPEAFSFEVGADWATGYYDLKLTAPDGTATHHFICVRKGDNAPKARAVLVLNTNTYQSYNYWGGANSYAHVDKLMSGELEGEAVRDAAIGRLSRLRPYAQRLLVPPPGAPRLVNAEPRARGQMAIPGTAEFWAEYNPTPYDGSAGFIDKWEHRFAAWAEAEGIAFDYLTDHDFERGPGILDGYQVVILVGHSEYWSANERDQLDAFVEAGGKLACFSGNTGYWKVRWEDGGDTLIAHKWKGETDDPKWADPATRGEATHLWSHPAFGRNEAQVTGLSFLYGGYHRLGMCVGRGSAAYTVYDDTHWALEDTDLYYGDAFGSDVPLLGYENDGCPLAFGDDGLPMAAGGVGIPDNLHVIGIAPATLAEDPRSPYPPIIPPEKPEVLAKLAHGREDEGAIARLMRGHAVMASFEKGKGEVFNGGTTEWAHGLAAGDPFVAAITRNVLKRFGV